MVEWKVLRINCHPEDNADQAKCEARGCIWDVSSLLNFSCCRLTYTYHFIFLPNSWNSVLKVNDEKCKCFHYMANTTMQTSRNPTQAYLDKHFAFKTAVNEHHQCPNTYTYPASLKPVAGIKFKVSTN